jgi:hypothetical protein
MDKTMRRIERPVEIIENAEGLASTAYKERRWKFIKIEITDDWPLTDPPTLPAMTNVPRDVHVCMIRFRIEMKIFEFLIAHDSFEKVPNKNFCDIPRIYPEFPTTKGHEDHREN